MRIGVLSDTHGHVGHCREAVHLLESLDVQAVLHCGDIGSAAIVDLLSGWPAHFVLGNCDADLDELVAAIGRAGMTCHGWFADLHLAGRRIAMTHGHLPQPLAQAQQSGEFDLVCYGHTHHAEQRWHGRTLVLNPGALYRARPLSFAIVDLEKMAVEQFTLPAS
jgi:putative phosphoesterase